MVTVLTNYLNGLHDLEYHTNRIELVSNLLGLQINPQSTHPIEKQILAIQSQSISIINQKQFNYSSIVISLYGYFENFVEDLIRYYLTELNSCAPSFSALHENIIRFHVDLSFNLIQKLGSNRYSSITLEDIISNLHSCSSGATNYLVNQEAFTLHEANLRPNMINEIFNRVGMENIFRRAVRETTLLKYLLTEVAGANYNQVASEDEQRLAESSAKEYVTDLAERRNEISHGVPANLLGQSELIKYIAFFKELGKSLFTVVWREMLPYKTLYQGINLGKPLRVINNEIVAFELENLEVCVGDVLVGERENNIIKYLPWVIQEIQVDRQSFLDLKIAKPTKIAFKVKSVPGSQCKDNYSYSLIKKSDYDMSIIQ